MAASGGSWKSGKFANAKGIHNASPAKKVKVGDWIKQPSAWKGWWKKP